MGEWELTRCKGVGRVDISNRETALAKTQLSLR